MSDGQRTFDYIVMGAGSAGCVLAARLSETGRYSVLLLEAGPPDSDPWIHIPLGFSRTYFNPKINWKFESEPQPELEGRRLYLPRGKTLGGTSAINGMIYIRGNPADYNGWAQRGCAGWGWDSVLPFFKKAEDQARGADDFHGVGGPLRVSDHPDRSVLADAFLVACDQAGIPLNPDFNGKEQAGAGYYQITTKGNRRWSAAAAYLKPAKGRANLVVETGAHTTRILIESHRATGVEYNHQGVQRIARARREVVVCGGTFASPQILMLSGLGPAEHLRSLGIGVVRDLPAVGSNLHDHFNVYTSWRCSQPVTFNELQNSWLRRVIAGISYALLRTGPMATNGMYSGLFTTSDPVLERPDLQVIMLAYSMAQRTTTQVRAHPFPAFSLMPVHLRPEGRGTVRLRSADPLAAPVVQFDYLRTEYDLQAMIAGIRLCRRIVAQDGLKSFASGELQPGPSIQTDADLVGYIRRTGITNSHPTSTCAMGPAANSVVDPRLRVHGVSGLRVADASIMPSVVSGNTNAPTIMIGEKAAAMILEDALGAA